MRRKRLGRYVQRLKALQGQTLTRDKLLMKLGAARHDAGRVGSVIKITLPEHTPDSATASFEFRLDRPTLRRIRRREGRYVLRTNLCAEPPERLWSFYIQLTEVEQAFKEIKHDLAIRPILHQLESRIEAHIFVAFLAYCLQVTLKARLKPLAPGLTPRQALDKFRAVQMLDVHIPTHDQREVILTRYTQPDADLRVLLQKLGMQLPAQPTPRITSMPLSTHTEQHSRAAAV